MQLLSINNKFKILCDASPEFTGDKDCDHMAISVLNASSLLIARNSLKIGGNIVMKALYGNLEKLFFVIN